MALLIVAAILVHRRWNGGLVAGTVAVMLVLQAAATYGYARSPNGVTVMRDLARMIWDAAPEATVINDPRNRTSSPSDLAIYLNRPIPLRPLPTEGGRPTVVLLYQRRDDPPPAPPEGFDPIGKVVEGRNTWHAFQRR